MLGAVLPPKRGFAVIVSTNSAAKPYMEQWKNTEANYDEAKINADFKKKLAAWETRAKAARESKKPVPNKPHAPRNPLVGQHRPANLYNGVLKPIIGYGIKGAIWYQGESNSSRAKAYAMYSP